MDILVLYAQRANKDRKTINDHLCSFKRYVEGHTFYYLNVLEKNTINRTVLKAPFDAVIMHYTFVAQRYDPVRWKRVYRRVEPKLAALSGYKVMLPQDDYNYTEDLWNLIMECGVDHVYSIIPQDQLGVAYPPERIGRATCSTVLTGYIDEASLQSIEAMAKDCKRSIDIGYRARKLPYWVGYHGQLKTDLRDRFKEALTDAPDIAADIDNTDAQGCSAALLGDDWTRFLLSCRCMLGSLGGSSILDPDGGIVKRVNAYCEAHPEAEYEQVKAACYPDAEDSIRGFMLSPRIFECAMTRTCQLLVEGDYTADMKPGVDYIEIKRDFSNIPEVLERVRDRAYCEKIAEQCYEHVVQPGNPDNPYTYRWFANHVIDHIEAHRERTKTVEFTPQMRRYLDKRCAYFASEKYLVKLQNAFGGSFVRKCSFIIKLTFEFMRTQEGRRRIWRGIIKRLPGNK